MSDELSAALRELAAARATAPIVGGPATRARAMRRRRRRRAAATLGAGTAALALLGFALTLRLGEDQDHPAGRGTSAAASSGSAPSSVATPVPVSGTLDLPGGDLRFGDREMPILSTFDLSPAPTSTTPMTVVAKPVRIALAADLPSKGATVVNVAYAVRLRDAKGGLLYVGAFAPDIEARGDYDVTAGVIALSTEDAQWFYARIPLGTSITVTTGPTPTTTPSSPEAPASPSAEAQIAPPARAPTSAAEGTG
ncbi:L,D-transpeptidase [Streptomyces sp. NPDC058295]|uniref:L,D-transpeptidase n=1 Tax=Streptomyces sp. NPDC058295 TaxID=3346431 RepID=UPI0036EB54E0